jgi:hypothetical protein
MLTASDDFRASRSWMATVTVVDPTPPEIACNALATIAPSDAPIEHPSAGRFLALAWTATLGGNRR